MEDSRFKFRYIFEDIREDGRTLVTQIWNLNDIEINDIIYDTEVLIARNQYTGLKDKNGVEIYEGDIIKVLGDKSTVFWQQGAFKFQNISNYNIQPLFDFATINKCVAYEVIGNIYENPELLKKI